MLESSNDRTVVLIDPQLLVRTALKAMINSSTAYTVVGEASDMFSALASLEKLNPKILLTEVALPGPSGIELIRELKRRELGCSPAILTAVDPRDFMKCARAAGAKGFLLKTDPFDTLLTCLDSLDSDNYFFSPQVSSLTSQLESTPDSFGDLEDPLLALSPREREIFHLLASGLQNAVIAKKLYISPRTVETHRARVVRKLGLTSNAELIRFAIRHGLSVV